MGGPCMQQNKSGNLLPFGSSDAAPQRKVDVLRKAVFMRAKLRRRFSCLHRIRPEFASIFDESAHPDEMQRACEEVLARREHVLWTAGLELVVAAMSFLGFDIRRSPLVPCVSSTLLLLAGIGYHGALVLSQAETVVHTLLSTSIAAAICVNFVIETLAGTFESTASMPPVWLLFAALVLPYFILMCLAATSVFLGLAMHDLRQMSEESSISSEELEMQAERVQGQDVCCVCAAERKDAALVPCGHKAMCTVARFKFNLAALRVRFAGKPFLKFEYMSEALSP
ncbi:unnamed protein product [Durusdinium trenchii]|uniref:Uncharacterized protein n=1 Tax=Durusdinium trenchii TaxID=1381693 RepID=A0ABP0M3W3_9DINO